MHPYRIILADDHNIFRAGLKGLIEKDPEFKVVAEARDGEQLLEGLKSKKCDLIVLDLSMPNRDGLATLNEIKEKYPQIKILVLTMLKDPEHFKHALAQGADGYLLKDDAYDQLNIGIKMILKKGKQFISPAISNVVTDHYIRSIDEADTPSLGILTKREQQILKLIARGFPNKNIASRLKISVRTVESHRANLSSKLGLKNTAGLVKYAIAKGIIS